MSTKTIAMDSRVYAKLAMAKRESESFSKAIDRILGEVRSKGTAADVLLGLKDLAELPEQDALLMLKCVADGRDREEWRTNDLS